MSAAAKRLDALKALLAEAQAKLGLKFGIKLWDGRLIPHGYPDELPRIAIHDEAVIASLVRRPSLDTLLKAHVAGRASIENGTLFDLAAMRPEVKTSKALKQIGYGKIARTAARFLLAPSKPPPDLKGGSSGSGTPESNQANIAYHYDVSNDFYRLFLDGEMLYSCAYFKEDHGDIDRAQADKLDMICRKLRLKPGERFLDIGCGWGALVCHAAKHYGVQATGITLSKEQLALATEKVRARGLEASVTLMLKDYSTLEHAAEKWKPVFRNKHAKINELERSDDSSNRHEALEGEFDKIASIGMFEHVGIKNHADYFRVVHRLLRPRGLYLHHAITRPAKKDDKSFSKPRAEYRAMIRYIFPGAELDHIGMTAANLERFKFEVHDVEAWREHYQRTTRLWHDRLLARRDEAERIAGPEKTRMWLLYLAGCSLGFERGSINIFQTLASKRARGASGLPLTRGDLYG